MDGRRVWPIQTSKAREDQAFADHLLASGGSERAHQPNGDDGRAGMHAAWRKPGDILATPPKSSALAPCSLLATSHVLLCALCSDESPGRAPFVWEGPPAHPPVQLGPQGWATIRGGGEGARASQGTRARQRTHRVRVLGIPIRRSCRRASTRAHRAPASHEGLQRIARSNLVLTGSCPLAVRPLYWRGEAWRACAERWSRRVPPLRWGGSPATGEKLPWPSTAFHCLPPPSTSLPPPSIAYH